jgi:hypothetical protein
MVVRFINNIVIDSKINSELTPDKSKRIPLEYFAVSRCLQQRAEGLYERLVFDENLCALVLTWEETGLLAAITDSTERDPRVSETAQELLQHKGLFELLHTNAGVNWLTQHEIRNRASQFLSEQRKEPGPVEKPITSEKERITLNDTLDHVLAIERTRQDKGLPPDPVLSQIRGGLYMRMRLPQDALAAYEDAERLQLERGLPPDPGLWWDYALALYDVGNRGRACTFVHMAKRLYEEREMPVPLELDEFIINNCSGGGRAGTGGE